VLVPVNPDRSRTERSAGFGRVEAFGETFALFGRVLALIRLLREVVASRLFCCLAEVIEVFSRLTELPVVFVLLLETDFAFPARFKRFLPDCTVPVLLDLIDDLTDAFVFLTLDLARLFVDFLRTAIATLHAETKSSVSLPNHQEPAMRPLVNYSFSTKQSKNQSGLLGGPDAVTFGCPEKILRALSVQSPVPGSGLK
jgi:hypothetical protein